ncbi:N-acetylmuramoyl-L-alanine amidase [Bacillus velezensis]|nr:N-acetylmuramoyl-L-alanine amidase [Bacillus velezensis]
MKKRTLALILCGVIITALLPSFHTAIAAEGEAVIATDKINVRGGPGLSYGIKAEVKKGERYPITKEEGDWVQLQLSPGKTGWVVSWLISKTAGGADHSSATSGTVTSTDPDLRIRKGPGHRMKSSANFRKARMHPCWTRTADG